MQDNSCRKEISIVREVLKKICNSKGKTRTWDWRREKILTFIHFFTIFLPTMSKEVF